MLLRALRRFATLLALSAGAAALLGLVLAGLVREGVLRGIAIGFYVVGVGLCALAFLLGSRPPVRLRDRDGTGGFVGFGRWVSGTVRFATRTEQDEALNVPALFIALGVCLIAIGAAVDTRHPLT